MLKSGPGVVRQFWIIVMRKILISIVAAIIVVSAGAYFGWDLYAQFRSKSEVEAVFDNLRTAFSTASHGRIELSTKTRTVKISDIILQSSDRATTIKIGQLIATGTKGPVGARVSAAHIQMSNWELTTVVPITSGPSISYKAPMIQVEGFTGPAALPLKLNTASIIDVSRASLEYLAASTITAVNVPKLTANITPKMTDPSAPAIGPIEYTYTDIAMRNIRDSRIAAITIERTTVTSDTVNPELGSFAAALARMSLSDFELGTAIALLDPAKGQEDKYLPMYRQASMGPFEVRFAKGTGMQMDSITIDEIGIRPSKLSIINLLAIADTTPSPGTPPTPAQLRMLIDQIAYMYEGIRFGNFQMRGLKLRAPDTDIKLDTIRLTGLENGRLGEFAVEGLDGTSTQQKEPVHVGRFALKGLQIANLVRQSGRMAESPRPPSPDQMSGMLALLEGIELGDVTASPIPGQPNVKIDTFRLSWGQFVGSVPTSVRLTAKTTVPTNLADPATGGMLSDAGLAAVTTNIDVGIAWTEATQELAVTPGAIEIENAFAFSANIAIRNVPRSIFSTDPGQAMMASEQLEAGPIMLSLRDAGALKTALEQYAKTKGISVDEARKEVIESVKETVKPSAQPNPDADAVAQAIIQFIETPGSTVTVSVTPKGHVNFKQAFDKANADPNSTVALFAIEAKTTK
jgi:hypothetical protein